MMRLGFETQHDEMRLRRLIRSMTPRTKFYKVLKEELLRAGHWRNLPRGRVTMRNLKK